MRHNDFVLLIVTLRSSLTIYDYVCELCWKELLSVQSAFKILLPSFPPFAPPDWITEAEAEAVTPEQMCLTDTNKHEPFKML